MKRVAVISTAILKNWTRSRAGVFFSILFPVMLLLIFASVFGGGGTSRFTLYLQNLDLTPSGSPTDLSQTFVEVLNRTDAFDLKMVPSDSDARRFVQDQLGPFGGTFRLLILPAGFESDMVNSSLRSRIKVVSTTARTFLEQAERFLPLDQRGSIEQGLAQLELATREFPVRNVSLVYLADPSNTGSTIVHSMLESLAMTFNYRIIGVESNVQVQPETVTERRFQAIDYYLPGLIGAFVMTNGIIGVTTNTTEFRRRGVLKRLATTPLTRFEWVLGNIVSQTILAFLLVAVMITVAWAAFGLQAIPDLLTLLLIVVGAAMFSGIGLVLAGVITDVEAASAAGNAIAFPMMFLSGSFWPVEVMPSYLQAVSQVLPLTYFSNGLRSALIFHHLPSILTSLGVVAVLAVIFLGVGSAITRWQER